MVFSSLQLSSERGDESRQQQIVTIELPNDDSRGFGFGIVSVGEPTKTVVHSLLAGGVAEQVHVYWKRNLMVAQLLDMSSPWSPLN